MEEFLFALTLSALPVVSNFMGAMIAEALPSSKQTLGLALHAAAGVLLAIASTELIPRVAIAKPVWATILALFFGGAFYFPKTAEGRVLCFQKSAVCVCGKWLCDGNPGNILC